MKRFSLFFIGALVCSGCSTPSFEEQFQKGISVEQKVIAHNQESEVAEIAADIALAAEESAEQGAAIEATCPTFFTESSELINPAAVRNILDTVRATFDTEFRSGEIVFLDRQQLATVLAPCELALFDQLKALDPARWGIRFPVLPEEAVIRTNFAALPPPESLRQHISPQFTPNHIANAYVQMMEQMEADIGRKLYVESAYRSPYYQAYLFLDYINTFGSVAQTAKYVALPGRSEHGAITMGALDFITADGISDNDVGAFIDRREYDWLEQNAMKYGFHQTFGVASRYGYGFEPWHWHYEPLPQKISDLREPYGTTRIAAQDEWGRFIENLPLKPLGNRTMLLFRRENRADGSEFINGFTNYVYENIIRTMAVVDIPVTSWQDCSKQITRLIALFAEQEGKKSNLSFPIAGEWRAYQQFQSEYPERDFEDYIKEVMIFTGTLSWRQLLEKIPESEVRIGDLIIQPQVSMAVDPIYGEGAVIGHTAVIVGISEDSDGHRYYLVGSGSLPVTSFRISKATNGWQGWDGWFDVEGYKHRTKADRIEFYRMRDFVERAVSDVQSSSD